jgi:glycosyltransferase involved in cell wall biosynthesis
MKIGVVSFHDLDYGMDVAGMLAEAGHSVFLYVSHQRADMAIPGEVTERRFYELGLLPKNVAIRLYRFSRLRNPANLKIVKQIHHQMQQDGIQIAHLLVAQGDIRSVMLSYRLKEIPTAATMIVPQPNLNDAVPAWMVKFVYGTTAARSDLVIVNGKNQVELVQRLYHLSGERVVHIPLGAQSAQNWLQVKQPEEPGTILFFGRAALHKGLEYLVRAQPIISKTDPSARFLISAYGEDFERCKALIVDPGKFEIHEGFVTGDQLASIFQRASIVALPYLTASTSGILMTAMAFGKALVATNVGCLPEYIQDGVTGMLVPPHDEKKLAQAILRLLENDELRTHLGKNAAERIAGQRKEITNQYETCYQKAVHIHTAKK